MAKFHDEWTVLPHDPVEEVAPGILTVVGQIPMPLGNFPRRMTVIDIGKLRTAVYSPVALDERSMARIETLGVPAYLIVPNGAHRLDLRPFHRRYPKAKIITAPGSKEQVEQAVKPVQTSARLGDGLELVLLAGSDDRELALRVERDGEVTLVTNDVIGHVAHPRGLGARIMARLMGFGPSPRITRPAKWFFIKDKPALAAQLREWAATENLRRLIPSHGDIIDHPAAVLREMADTLT